MPEVSESKYLTQMGWDETPHLDEKTKRELLKSTPPYLRDARSKGIPSLGAGAIYPIPESEITVEPFELPDYWPRIAGFDVGWNRTAALWGAHDRDNSVLYLYGEYYRGEAEPSVHATGLKTRGDWIPLAIDPAARGRGQHDGKKLFQMYSDLGLQLIIADNALEAGLYGIWEDLSTQRIKVFSTLKNFFAEYRLYRRDQNGKVVAENDHLMDAMRYLKSRLNLARTKPRDRKRFVARSSNPITGY